MRDLDWRSFDVLVVDDEEDNLDAFRFAFRKSFTLHYALGGAAGLETLERLDPAVIVSDQRMPGMSGVEFLKRAKERRPDALGILLTAYTDLPVLIDAVNSGAVDRYLQKPWDSKELTVVLRQAISNFATIRENRRLREQLAHYTGYLEREQRDPIDFGELTCESPAAKELSARIALGAPTSSLVLIEGEQGTEKEIVARAVHVGSPREERPFVKVTCAAFRGDALERELFGWERGAFPGAFTERAGRFELAHKGTLFLDELGAPSASLEARLLRLLNDREVERAGGTEPIPVDVRVVASCTPSLASSWSDAAPQPEAPGMHGAPATRGELAARLGIFSVRVPPLRERREDIHLLAAHFLRKYARRNPRAATSLSGEALAKLDAYAWPGNVRELENVIERAAILSRSDVILPEHLAFAASSAGSALAIPVAALEPHAGEANDLAAATAPRGWPGAPSARPRINLDSQLDDIERRELLAALARCNGNKAEVARSLGVQRTTLYYRLKRLGIDA
jgi:two-component system, NtrC family, response regulator AtoC